MHGVRAAIGTAVLVVVVPVLAPSAPAAGPKSTPQSLLVAAMADLRGGHGIHVDAFGDGSFHRTDAADHPRRVHGRPPGIDDRRCPRPRRAAGSVPVFADADVTSGVVDASLTPSGQGDYMLTVDGHVAVDGDAEFRVTRSGAFREPRPESVAIVPFVNAPGYLILEKHAITGYPGFCLRLRVARPSSSTSSMRRRATSSWTEPAVSTPTEAAAFSTARCRASNSTTRLLPWPRSLTARDTGLSTRRERSSCSARPFSTGTRTTSFPSRESAWFQTATSCGTPTATWPASGRSAMRTSWVTSTWATG